MNNTATVPADIQHQSGRKSSAPHPRNTTHKTPSVNDMTRLRGWVRFGSTDLSGVATALYGVSSLFTNFSRKTPYFSGVSLKLLFSLVIFLYHQCFPKSFCYKWGLAPLFLFQTNPVKLHASMVIPTSLYVILLLVT